MVQGPGYLESQHADFVQQWTGYDARIPGVPGEWNLYDVIRGVPAAHNGGYGTGQAYRAKPLKSCTVSSANWKGYEELFQLTAKGRLILLCFQYYEGTERQHIVGKMLDRDFFMVIKQSFFEARLYVPFRNGVLVTDRATWLCDIPSALDRFAEHPSYRAFDLYAPWMTKWLAYRVDETAAENAWPALLDTALLA